MEKNIFAEVMLSQITSLLAFGGALLYSLTQLSKVRLPAQLVAAGCAIVLVERVIWAYTYDSLMRKRLAENVPHKEFAAKMANLGFLFSLLYLCGIALIIVAVFVGRTPRPAPTAALFGGQPPFPLA